MGTLETRLPRTVGAPQQARALLRTALHGWALDAFGNVLELLTSELVANAVIHGTRGLELRVTKTPDTVRVEVYDGADEPPSLQRPDRHAVSGRGVYLVHLLASDWGVELHPEGKTVWFEIDTTADPSDWISRARPTGSVVDQVRQAGDLEGAPRDLPR